jgi:hypothetical protein
MFVSVHQLNSTHTGVPAHPIGWETNVFRFATSVHSDAPLEIPGRKAIDFTMGAAYHAK